MTPYAVSSVYEIMSFGGPKTVHRLEIVKAESEAAAIELFLSKIAAQHAKRYDVSTIATPIFASAPPEVAQ